MSERQNIHELASIRFKNSWDEIYICDCCRATLADLERERPTRSVGASCVYFIGPADGPIKIGVAKNAVSRLAALQTSHPEKLFIHAVTPGDGSLERKYHRRFSKHRLSGEWFKRHPDILSEIERVLANPSPSSHGRR